MLNHVVLINASMRYPKRYEDFRACSIERHENAWRRDNFIVTILMVMAFAFIGLCLGWGYESGRTDLLERRVENFEVMCR